MLAFASESCIATVENTKHKKIPSQNKNWTVTFACTHPAHQLRVLKNCKARELAMEAVAYCFPS
jgi:hypothetical protein